MNYLYWLAAAFWLPTIVLWRFVRKPIVPKLKAASRFAAVVVLTYMPFEYVVLRYPMVMGEGQYLGIRFITFPLEDFLFFFTIPFFVIGLVYLIDEYMVAKW